MSRNLEFELNGKACRRDVEPNTLLKDMLRLDLGMTGTKETCGEGICGACTVLVNGMPVRSCLALRRRHGPAGDVVDRLGDRGQAGGDRGVEPLALRRQLQPTMVADEQVEPERGLELADAVADR